MSIFYQVGKYLCEGTGQALGETSNGNAQFVLKFNVLSSIAEDGSTQDVDRSFERTMYLVLNENTIVFAIDNLRKLGFTGTSFAELDPSTKGFHDFSGEQFEMWCKHDLYKGKEKEVWNVASGGAAMVKPIDNKKLRFLDSKFGSQLKASAPAKPTGRPVPVSAPVDAVDDEVPF